jgi:hypothetical protein
MLFRAAGLRASNLIVLVVPLLPAVGAAAEARVIFRDALVTAKFEAAALGAAFQAIRSATGVEIVVPPSIQSNSLTLSVHQIPLESFLQRLVGTLNLGGFALVYDRDGGASRIIIADIGRTEHTAPGAPPPGARPFNAAKRVGEDDRPSVLFLIPPAEADSMNVGTWGQVIAVESAPIAMVKASECGGAGGDYPVQNVMVMDETTTRVTSIIVCAPPGLDPGVRLTATPAQTDAQTPPGGGARYLRVRGMLHRSAP